MQKWEYLFLTAEKAEGVWLPRFVMAMSWRVGLKDHHSINYPINSGIKAASWSKSPGKQKNI